MRDRLPEGLADVRDLGAFEGPDGSAEVAVSEYVLDPAVKVPAPEMTPKDVVRPLRDRREEVSNGSRSRPGWTAPQGEHEFVAGANRNIRVFAAMADGRREARDGAESHGRRARP